MKTCPQCGVTYKDNVKHCQDDGAQLEAIEELQPGTILNKKYRIVEELGHGGMGVVYRAQHILFKEDRALKLINARYSDDPQAVRRFLAEALMARQIDHRNVVRVFDAEETEDGQPYVVMEYVEGDSLRRLLRQGSGSQQRPLDPLRAIAIAIQVCAALAAAHHKEIVHRDIKPDNILVARNPDGADLVKVVDFGIAKAKKELQGPWSGTLSLSQSGVFLGTPAYSSPEQAAGTKGDLLDHRTDIYSLGIVLYEMLVGRPPFTGDVEDVLHQQKEAAPKDLRNLNRAIPEDLGAVAMKALSKSPAARFSSADEMRQALERARDAMLRPPPVQVPKEEPLAPTMPREPKPPRPTPIPAPAPEPLKPPPARQRPSPNRAIVVGFLLAIVLGLLAYWALVPDSTTSQPVQVQDKLARAKQLYEQGAYDDAIALYKEVQSVDPANPEASGGVKAVEAAKEAERTLSGAQPAQPAAADSGLSGFKFEFVKIQPGEFMMGCSPGDSECDDYEKPAHRVRITKGFELGKYEVTQGMWESVMGNNPTDFKGVDRPVETVSWNEIQEFLKRLNQRGDGYRYRLPTEAEWEYAARAGTTGAYPVPLDRTAWYDSNSGGQTHPVGQKEPNAWGLYDMLGNVWEWVEDWYDARYYANSPGADPRGPSTGQYRVRRGGSWIDVAWARVSSRIVLNPADRYYRDGFRCAREVVP